MDVILTGACGRMGSAVAQLAPSFGIRIVAGVDPFRKECPFPVYEKIFEVNEVADAIIDFSFHGFTPELCAYAREKGLPVVISTTGHTPEELEMIAELSHEVAVFRSGNMSVGVNLLIELCRSAAKRLGGKADIEIIEKHHNQKLDAPSGTALMIASEIREELPEENEYVYDRTGRREVRPQNEIGISSVRGGNIVGEHEVMFCFGNEILSVKHTALGRAVFAEGALRVVSFLTGQKPGMYSMKEFLEDAAKDSATVS